MIEKGSLTKADSKAEHKNLSNKLQSGKQSITYKYIGQAVAKAARAAI